MTLEDFSDVTDDTDEGETESDSVSSADGGTAAGGAESDAVDNHSDNNTDDRDSFERIAADVAGDDTGMGALSVSQGLRVAEDDDETTLRAFITTGNREAVRIGKYLLVPYPDDETLFCRITGLEYAQEFPTTPPRSTPAG